MIFIEKPTQEIVDAFQEKYNEDYEHIGCHGYTIEVVCQHIKELDERFTAIFPQDEPFDAMVSVCNGGEWKDGETERIIHALEEMPHFTISYCVVHDKHTKLEQDEIEVLMTVGNIDNYEDRKTKELIRRAVEDDDGEAARQLVCQAQSYEYEESDRIDDGFHTEWYVMSLLAGASTSISKLRALSRCFRKGLVVEKDERMAKILGTCAKVAMLRYTEEELEEQSCEIDYTIDPYIFYSDNAEDRQYVFRWVEKTAFSDSFLRRQASYMLREYYRYGVECEKDPFKARRILLDQFYKLKGLDDLQELGCLPNVSSVLGEVAKKVTRMDPKDYANYYKTLFRQHHEFYPCLFHLYEYGICTEDIEGKSKEEMNHFEQMYEIAQTIGNRFTSPQERFDYLCTQINEGSSPAIFFLDNDACLADLPREEIVAILKKVYDIVMKRPSPITKSYFVKLCDQFMIHCNWKDLYPIIKSFADEGNRAAADYLAGIKPYYRSLTEPSQPQEEIIECPF